MTADAPGLAGASVDDALLVERRGRRGRWRRLCPFCLSSALKDGELGALACAACGGELAPPPHRPRGLPTHATPAAHPRWEDDYRLGDGTWDRYARSGDLVREWGRSTDRQDGGPPPEGDVDEPEHMPPRIRAKAVLGREDDVLDAMRAAETDHIAGLRTAIDQLKRILLGLGKADDAVRKARRPSRRPGVEATRALAVLLEHTAQVGETLETEARAAELRAVMDRDTKPETMPWTPPAWAAALSAAYRVAMRSQLEVLGILCVNALRERGIEVEGSAEPIRPRTRRSTPFAGYGHAIAVVFGVSDPGESSPLPRNAVAKHALPRGVVLGQIACKPTREYPSWTKGLGSDETDIEDAIDAARVGARTYLEHGKHRRDPGRPLSAVERELLRLVDAGDVRRRAVGRLRKGRRGERQEVVQLAVERLTIREALARVQSLDGAPRTEREAKLALAAARKAIRLELGRRGLIPGYVVEEPKVAPAPVVTTGDRRRRRRAA